MKAILLVFAIAMLNVNTANACSFRIDEEAQKAELEQVVLAAYKTQSKASAKTEAYEWEITKNTPMCPDEITHTATITVRYQYPRSPASTCVVDMTVKKIDNWADSKTTYEISGRNTARCTR